MATIGTLALNVVARTARFERGMRRANRKVTAFSAVVGTAKTVVKGFAVSIAAMGTVAVVGGLVTLTKRVEDFNKAMTNSLAIMGDVSKTMRRDMRQAAFDVAKATRFSGEEAAKAYFFLASAGLTAAQSIKALPVVAKFAQAGMFDLSKATELLVGSQAALGLASKDAEENMRNLTRVGDVLVQANILSQASVEEFAEGLTNKTAGWLRILNRDVEEGVALLAVFAKQNIKGAEGGSAASIVLRELATKSIANRKAWKDMGLSVFDANEEFRSIPAIIKDIEDKLGGMSGELKQATLAELGFTAKSISFIQAILGNADSMQEFLDKLEAAGGKMEEVSGKQLTAFDKAWQELSGTVEEFANKTLPPVITLLTELLKVMTELTDAASKLRFPKIDTGIGAFSFGASRFGRSGVAQPAAAAEETVVAAETAKANVEKLVEKERREAAAKAIIDVRELVSALEEEAAQVGIVGNKLKLLAIAEKTTNDTLLKRATTALDVIETRTAAFELQGKMEAKAASIFAETRTEAEKFVRIQRDLDSLLKNKLITEEAFARATAAAKENLEDSVKATKSLQAPGGTAAVTRRSVAGFSAVQAARRQQQAQLNLARRQLTATEGIWEEVEEIGRRLETEDEDTILTNPF